MGRQLWDEICLVFLYSMFYDTWVTHHTYHIFFVGWGVPTPAAAAFVRALFTHWLGRIHVDDDLQTPPP